MFVVMSRDCYGGCNCSCFETDEVFGPFETEAEAEKWGKKRLKWQYRVQEIRALNTDKREGE